jgi:hypothetical protein
MELRVLRITFLSSFNLSRSFDFARYITISEESNIIHMLEVTAGEWVVVLVIFVSACCLYTVNGDDVARHDVFLTNQCEMFSDGDNHRYQQVESWPLISIVLMRFVC